MHSRPLAIAVVALFLALLLPVSEAQDTQPAHCRAVSLSSFQEYTLQNVRMVWDSYTIDSKGVCVWEKSSPPNTMPACRYGVQLAKAPFGWYANLCWWGRPTEPLRSTLTMSDVRRIVEELVARPEVQDRLGPGQHIIELDIGGNLVTVVTRDGKVATIEGRVVPPTKCYSTYLGGYREYADPRVKKTWDEYSADSVGVCRWDVPDRPLADQCNHMVEFGGSQPGIPPFWLCWWGKVVSVASHNQFKPDVIVQMDRDAWLTIANSPDPGSTAWWMVQNKYIALTFENAATQALVKGALAATGGQASAATTDMGWDSFKSAVPSGWSPPKTAFGPSNPTPTWSSGPDTDHIIPWGVLVTPDGEPGRLDVWSGPVRTMIGLPPTVPVDGLTIIDPYPAPGSGAGWNVPMVGPPESILDDIGENFPPPESILDDVDQPAPTTAQMRLQYDVGSLVALQDRFHEELQQREQARENTLTFPWYAGSTGVNTPLTPGLTGGNSWTPLTGHGGLRGGLLRGQGYYEGSAGVIR